MEFRLCPRIGNLAPPAVNGIAAEGCKVVVSDNVREKPTNGWREASTARQPGRPDCSGRRTDSKIEDAFAGTPAAGERSVRHVGHSVLVQGAESFQPMQGGGLAGDGHRHAEDLGNLVPRGARFDRVV